MRKYLLNKYLKFFLNQKPYIFITFYKLINLLLFVIPSYIYNSKY